MKMLIRKSRLCQVLCTLMIVTAILPILFTYLSTSTAPNAALDPFPLYAPRELQFNNHLDQTSNEADSSRNLTNLMVARQNYLLSIVGGSLEEQVAFGFADLTNRLRYAESYASDRRQEIKQLMKEIRHLWELIQHNDTDKTVSNLNSNDVTAKGKYLHVSFDLLSVDMVDRSNRFKCCLIGDECHTLPIMTFLLSPHGGLCCSFKDRLQTSLSTLLNSVDKFISDFVLQIILYLVVEFLSN